jgi:hypothetical protein
MRLEAEFLTFSPIFPSPFVFPFFGRARQEPPGGFNS